MSDSIKTFFDSISTIADVKKLIEDEERESVTLDYKMADKRWNHIAKEKIAKHISAFANSEGGILVFGVECDEDDKDKPIALSGLHPQNGVEDFDRILTAAIRPQISGWARKKISDERTAVLLVYIPASDAGPHQSMKHMQYFHRSGAQSIPMEHYLVQRYFGKHYHPHLGIHVVEPERIRATYPKKDWTHYYSFQFMLSNTGKGNAKGCSGRLILPSAKVIATHHAVPYFNAQIEPTRSWQSDGPIAHYFDVTRDVHPGATYCFYELAVAFHRDYIKELEQKPLIEWEIFAEGMAPQHGTYAVSPAFLELLPGS